MESENPIFSMWSKKYKNRAERQRAFEAKCVEVMNYRTPEGKIYGHPELSDFINIYLQAEEATGEPPPEKSEQERKDAYQEIHKALNEGTQRLKEEAGMDGIEPWRQDLIRWENQLINRLDEEEPLVTKTEDGFKLKR